MTLARRAAAALLLTAVLVPVTASAASASPADEVNRAYCAAQKALGFDNIQDCRFLFQ